MKSWLKNISESAHRGGKLQRRHCCGEERVNHEEGYGKYGNSKRKNMKITSSLY